RSGGRSDARRRRVRQNGAAMDFELSEKLASRLLNEIDKESSLAKQLAEHRAMHGKMILSSKLFDAQALDVLYELCKADENRTLMLQVSALRNILGNPASREIGRMEVLVPGLVAYFADDAIDG